MRLFGLFRLFHVVKPELLRDISRSLRVLSATTNILIYLRNNSLIVLTYRGLNWLTGNESQPGLQLIEKLATPLREVNKIVGNSFFTVFIVIYL